MRIPSQITALPGDGPLVAAEHALWVLVASRGPRPDIVDVIEHTLNGGGVPAIVDDEPLLDFAEQLVLLVASGQGERARDVLEGSFEVAGLVWQAYQDGFEAGVASTMLEGHVGYGADRRPRTYDA